MPNMPVSGRHPAVESTKGSAKGTSHPAPYHLNIAMALAIAIGMGGAAWTVPRVMDPRFLPAPAGNDVCFEADLPTLADTMVHRWSDQSRNARHPLFPMLVALPAYG